MATQATDRYCPICGKPVTDETFNRFGEWCCSEAHADEYVAEVRSQKQRAVAADARPTRSRGGCC